MTIHANISPLLDHGFSCLFHPLDGYVSYRWTKSHTYTEKYTTLYITTSILMVVPKDKMGR